MNEVKNLKNFLRLGLVVAGALLIVSGCASLEYRPFKYYTIGFSTPDGNDIWIEGAEIDNTWSTPGGALNCCWEEASSLSGAFERVFPSVVRIAWLEISTNTHYSTIVNLDTQTNKIAHSLPGYAYIATGEKAKPFPVLILGIKPGGDVVVWVSNVTSSTGVEGRVLQIVGMAHAHGERESRKLAK